MEGRLEQLLARCGEHNVAELELMTTKKPDRRLQNGVHMEYTPL